LALESSVPAPSVVPESSGAQSSGSSSQGQSIACALCGANDTERLYTKWGWGIERCRRCALVYAHPRAPEHAILARYSRDYFWNEYLPAAGAPGGHVDAELYDRHHAPMLALIRAHAPGARRLLEVGTGAGLFLNAAARAGWQASGLELSNEGATFARERLGLDVRQERAETMSFAPGTFDVAVMFDVIEHLFDPRAVLEATRVALRPGGILVVATPNFDALSRFVLGPDWAVLSPLEHTYYYTERTLAAMLTACGFSRTHAVRRFAGWGPVETMNYRYTNAPNTLRPRLLAGLASIPGLPALVARAGAADALIAVAEVNDTRA
jgi:2-polyprenyl-3-methyl-5-hydroxy-6-metoxy-1,4-benzoquinol methylase